MGVEGARIRREVGLPSYKILTAGHGVLCCNAARGTLMATCKRCGYADWTRQHIVLYMQGGGTERGPSGIAALPGEKILVVKPHECPTCGYLRWRPRTSTERSRAWRRRKAGVTDGA